jgi:microcystin-dependent protein
VATPYIGEVRMMSFGFPPKGWALCNGQLMSIQQNTALFAILGTTFGGDGVSNFRLPDLQGRVPVHTGSGFGLGQAGGEAAHTLITSEIPKHTHTMTAVGTPAANQRGIAGNMPGAPAFNFYDTTATLAAMDPTAVTPNSGSQPHDNMQPYLVVNFCIALIGVFPTHN